MANEMCICYLAFMGKLLAFDWGFKRTGVAETDELQIIASPLTTVDTTGLMAWIETYLNQNNVDAFVIGNPSLLLGEKVDSSSGIQKFKESLQKEFPQIPVHEVDESFSSQEAMQGMIQGGMKKGQRRKKGNLDKVSAAVILQRYLAQNSTF